MDTSNILIPYRKGNLWGYCDREGKIVLEPKYGFLSPLKFGLAFFGHPSEHENYYGFELGILDEEFVEISPALGSNVFLIHGEVMISNKLRYGSVYNLNSFSSFFIDENIFQRNANLSPYYTSIIKVKEGVYLGWLDRGLEFGFTLFNESGEKIDPIFLSSGVHPVIGQQLTLFRFEIGYLKVNGKYGIINKEGKNDIPFIYDEMAPFSNGISSIKWKEGKYLLNEKGEILNELPLGRVWFDVNTRSWMGETELHYYEYKYLNGGNLNVYKFEKDNEFNYGKRICLMPITITDSLFHKALGLNHKSKGWFLLNKSGKFLLSFSVSSKTKLYNDFAIYDYENNTYSDDKKLGVVDSSGQMILPNRYNQLYYLGNGDFLMEDYEGFRKYFGIINYDNRITKVFDSYELLDGVWDPWQYFSAIDIVPDFDNELLVLQIKTQDGLFFHLGYGSFSGRIYSEGIFTIKFERENPEHTRVIDYDYDDDSYSSNPWDDVFGPGDEADDAHWNTRGE